MNDCIECNCAVTDTGYARQRRGGKKGEYAHRLAYCGHHGLALSAIAGKMVLHSCDNRKCVNPEHLRLGTHAQNMADRRSRKRQAMGERNAGAKLTAVQVLEIRSIYKPGMRGLANKYGVSRHAIHKIGTGRTWICLP